MIVLDTAARARLVDRFGPQVTAWCDGLPARVNELCDRWGLEVLSAAPGNTGRTLLCRDADGASKVLKLTPDTEIAATEAAALRVWADSRHVVDLLAADGDALLLDGIVPGTPLSDADIPYDQVDTMLADLATFKPRDKAGFTPGDKARFIPGSKAGFIPLSERVDFMFTLAARRNPDVLADVQRRSWQRAAELAQGDAAALVHGDLHPGNVLWGADGIVVIDPRPSIGDPAVDAVDWALHPLLTGGSLDDGIAALPSLDGDRVRDWCAALAVLLALSAIRRGLPAEYTEALLGVAR
ncbi:aminoglycoside phosphotransferase family protein [Amycolatopsis sp. cg5]|uniref:aminoglycoside phosphotransferase family protein n=1 Tax=Amycolatopsis sp. cg5 TaxID=3238802 RepID=UPI0035233E62